jgi:hypothetical protein
MPAPTKLSPEQWAEARRLRADGTPWIAIGAQLGLHETSLRKRAQREGWSTPEEARGAPADKPRRIASPGTAGVRSRLAQRLYKVIECRIRMMELRMTRQLKAHEGDPDAEPPAASKDESDSFAALIDSINKVTEMASEPAPAAGGGRKSAAGAAAGAINPELTALSDDIDPDGLAIASEKDQYRRELAEHLGKMFAKP